MARAVNLLPTSLLSLILSNVPYPVLHYRKALSARIKADVFNSPSLEEPNNASAQERLRKGGKIGGKARASKLTAMERSAIAKRVAAARWENRNQ